MNSSAADQRRGMKSAGPLKRIIHVLRWLFEPLVKATYSLFWGVCPALLLFCLAATGLLPKPENFPAFLLYCVLFASVFLWFIASIVEYVDSKRIFLFIVVGKIIAQIRQKYNELD